jgi:hypothetical protein
MPRARIQVRCRRRPNRQHKRPFQLSFKSGAKSAAFLFSDHAYDRVAEGRSCRPVHVSLCDLGSRYSRARSLLIESQTRAHFDLTRFLHANRCPPVGSSPRACFARKLSNPYQPSSTSLPVERPPSIAAWARLRFSALIFPITLSRVVRSTPLSIRLPTCSAADAAQSCRTFERRSG